MPKSATAVDPMVKPALRETNRQVFKCALASVISPAAPRCISPAAMTLEQAIVAPR
jgi:hypothetical protein